jgi:hypothetical protein
MAKEVTISTWCDHHLAKGDRVPATHSVIIGLSVWPRPQEIDLCDEDYKIIEAVDVMVMKYGRTSESEPIKAKTHGGDQRGRKSTHDLVADPASMGCPVCLKLYSGKGTNRTKYLAQHIRVSHAPRTIKDYSEDQLARATAEARDKIAHDE